MTRSQLVAYISRVLVASCLTLVGLVGVASQDPVGAQGTPRCTLANLSLSVLAAPSLARGERAVVLSATNGSRTECTVRGVPSLTLRDSSAHALRVRYATTSSPFVAAGVSRAVRLVAGASAYALIAKYVCTSGAIRSANRIDVAMSSTMRSVTTSRLRTIAECRGPRNSAGQLVGVSSWRASVRGTYAGARIHSGVVRLCGGPSTWPTRAVSSDVLTAVTSYYAAKKLTPISVRNATEWVLNAAAYREGTHWCLNPDGGAGAYTGSAPAGASAVVMLYVTHRPYPTTQSSASFVTLAKVNGAWRVVSEGTGP